MRAPFLTRAVAGGLAVLLAVVGGSAAAQPPGESALSSEGATVRLEGNLRVVMVDDAGAHESHADGLGADAHSEELMYALDVGGAFLPLDPAGSVELEGARSGQQASIEITVTPQIRGALSRGGVNATPLGELALTADALAELVQAGPLPVVSARVAPEAQPEATALAHSVYLVRVQDAAAGATPTDASARALAKAATDYWINQSGGIAQGFTVRGSTTMSFPGSCDTDLTWDLFAAAAARFPAVDSTTQPNHIMVVKPAGCRDQTDTWGQAELRAGIHSGGLLWGTDGDVGTMTHELGHNFSLMHSNVDWRHQPGRTLEYYGIYSPMGFTVPRSTSPYASFAPPVLDVGFQDALGLLPPGQLNVGGSRTVTLAPVTASTGVRAAKLVNPATGRPVYIEYRDGARGDADSYYKYASAGGYFELSSQVPAPVMSACVATHGAGSPQCEAKGYLSTGVRVYEIPADRSATTFPEARGLGYNATLARGKQITAPGGGFSVRVESISPGGATVRITIAKDTPTVWAAPQSTAVGSAVLDVTVSSRATPTGKVTVLRGSTTVGSATLVGGAAKVSLDKSLALGTHRLTVRYEGSDSHHAVASTVDVTLKKRAPALRLTIGKAYRGLKTRGTVTVPSPLSATGTVVIFLDSKKIRTLKLSGGEASFTLPKKLKLGKHKVRARYRGDAQHAAANRTVTVKVVKQKAKIKSFARGTKRVKAGKRYTDDVNLSHKGVLQRRAGSKWVKVRNVPKGKSTIRITAGKKKTSTKYRILIKTTGKVKGKKSKVLTIRAR